VQRSAEFIWTPQQAIASAVSFRDFIGDGPQRRDDGRNRWFLFRKTFALDGQPANASIDITADGRYILFVNGQRIGRGPSRCNPYYQRVDNHELTSTLQRGDNAIAILVHVYGQDMAWYETVKDYWQALFGDGGLYCECRADDLQINSDASWRCIEALAWNRDTPQSGWGQDFIEDFDARKLPPDWTHVGFDDSRWLSAQVLLDPRDDNDRAKGFGPVRAFPTLIPRDIPQLTEAIVSPCHVLATYGVVPDPALAIDARLYGEQLQACSDTSINDTKAMLSDDDAATFVRTTPGSDVGILLAFDKLHAGHPFIDFEAHGGEIIELAVAETHSGEFNDAAATMPRLQRRSFLDGAHLFRYTARAGQQRFEKFEWSAVRYLQIVVRSAPAGIRIRHVGSNAISYPVENQGAYECSDEFLTRLWKLGRHTVLQCSHDAWEDCPGREKRQWVGDGVVRYPIAAAAFGSSIQALDRRFLRQCAESQRTDGLLQMYAPGDHRTWGVVIPDYSLQYILIAHDYLMHTADLDTLERVLPSIQNILGWFENHVGEQQLLVDVPYWHFIEWANVGRNGAATCINALYAAALSGAAKIAKQLDIARLAQRYEAAAQRTREAINTILWDTDRCVYVDGLEPGSNAQFSQVSQQANALLIAFEIAPQERRAAIIDYITDTAKVKLTAVPPVVPSAEPFDIDSDVVRCNTFFCHFLYCALAQEGRLDQVIDLIRKHYGPMLASGATTLWESFDPGASLCHAFSATPLYQLSAYSLGVRPVEPGFARFIAAPQFHDLTFAAGAYPTPKGAIKVRWERQGSVVNVQLEVPQGLVGTFVPPAGFELPGDAPPLQAGRNEITLSEMQ
jgi:hypothetical protein